MTHDNTQKENIQKEIYLRKDQLLADIDAQIEIVAVTHLLQDGTRMPVFNNVLEQHKHLLSRWIEKYLDKAKAHMAAYVLAPEQKGAMDARRRWEEQTVLLSFPWYWNATTFSNLVLAVHDYIVNSVLMEFFVLALTSKDPVTADKQLMAEDAWSDIKHYCVTSLPGTQKKKLHPLF